MKYIHNGKKLIESGIPIIKAIKISATNILFKTDEEQFRIIESFAKMINSITIPIQILCTSEDLNTIDLTSKILDDNFKDFLKQKIEKNKITIKEFKIVIHNSDEDLVDNTIKVIVKCLKSCGLENEGIEDIKSEIVIPDLMTPEYIKIKDYYYKTVYVEDWPHTCSYGWLDAVYNSGINMDISMFIHPVPKQDALKYLKRKLAENVSNSILEEESEGELAADQFDERIKSAMVMNEQLMERSGKFYFMSFYVTIKSKDLAKLKKETNYVNLLLGGIDMELKDCYLLQDDGYKCTRPWGIDLLGKKYNFTTQVLKFFFPFISSNIIDKDGVLIGDNLLNSSLVFLNPFKYNSALMYILGKVGGGKSYLTKLFISRLIKMGIEIEIWDLTSEHLRLKNMINSPNLKIIHHETIEEYRKDMRRYIAEMDKNINELKPRLLFIDEFWRYLKDKEITDGVNYIALTGRQKYQGLCVILQMIEHLEENSDALSILRNASIKAIMQLEPNEAKIIQKELDLTQEEFSFLVTAQHEGILFAGSKHLQFKAVASEEEHNIITTDPKQRKELKGVENIVDNKKITSIKRKIAV